MLVKNCWMEVMTLPCVLDGRITELSVTDGCLWRFGDGIRMRPEFREPLVNIAHSRKFHELGSRDQIGQHPVPHRVWRCHRGRLELPLSCGPDAVAFVIDAPAPGQLQAALNSRRHLGLSKT